MLEGMMGLNWLGISVGVVVSFIFGAIWFHPKVLGTALMESWGRTVEDCKDSSSVLPMVTELASVIATAVLLAVLAQTSVFELGVVLLILTTALKGLSGSLFQEKRTQSWVITASYETIYILILGACIRWIA